MGTATKHFMPDRVKLSFVSFDIWALWCSGLRVRVPGCQKLWWLNQVWHWMLYSCTHMATVDVKGLNDLCTNWEPCGNLFFLLLLWIDLGCGAEAFFGVGLRLCFTFNDLEPFHLLQAFTGSVGKTLLQQISIVNKQFPVSKQSPVLVGVWHLF